MLNWMKKGLWILAIGVTFAAISDFCQKQTKGFAISKIAPSFSFEETQEVDPIVASVLDQPFHYLRKGNSAYVFVSDDDKYVLKFLRRPNLFPPFWTKFKLARLLLPSYSNAIITECERKKDLLLTSYRLAAEKLKDQTGIFYSHMNSTSLLKKNITFYDRIKIKHTLPADTLAFVLQKKAQPFCPYFKQLVDEHKKEKAHALLQEFALLLKERASKGVFDNDISPHYNLGIFEDHFMAFDLDGLKPCSIPETPEHFETHMLKDGRKMIHWLKSVDPEMSIFLQQEIVKLSLVS